jgi:AAA domain
MGAAAILPGHSAAGEQRSGATRQRPRRRSAPSSTQSSPCWPVLAGRTAAWGVGRTSGGVVWVLVNGQQPQCGCVAAADASRGYSLAFDAYRHLVKPLSRGRASTEVDQVPIVVPAPLTRFVGREQEIQELTQLLGETRLLTLIGAGGVGKTRLVLELAARAQQFGDGVCMVELATTADPEIIPHSIGQALRLPGQADRLEQLARALRDRHLLLVVDNCEHLIAACAAVVGALLQASPKLVMLATTRQPLGLAGETTWRVPSLSFPWPGAPAAREHIGQYEAVRLFLDRAAQAEPQFRLTSHNVAAVAEICYRLDGIPLALELAAAPLRVLTAEQVAARLSDRFRLLASAQRGGLGRHQTLLASVEWSHELHSFVRRPTAPRARTDGRDRPAHRAGAARRRDPAVRQPRGRPRPTRAAHGDDRSAAVNVRYHPVATGRSRSTGPPRTEPW